MPLNFRYTQAITVCSSKGQALQLAYGLKFLSIQAYRLWMEHPLRFMVNCGDRRWSSFGYLEENVNQIAPFSHVFARNGTSQPPKLFSDWATNICEIEFKRFSRAIYTLKLWPDNRYNAGRKEPGTRSQLRYLTYPVVGKK